jgi:putative oxidoreductase
MSFSEFISPLLGRLAIAWFFLREAFVYASDWSRTVALMELRHVSAAPAVLGLSLLLVGVGSLALAVGYHARLSAMFLFAVTMAVTIGAHDFWNIANLAEREAAYADFARNVALAGGLLMIVGLGAGGFAFDNNRAKGKK